MPFAGIDVTLSIERLVLTEFGIEDHRRQARSGTGAGNGMERCSAPIWMGRQRIEYLPELEAAADRADDFFVIDSAARRQ
jgi:hypothetical protein